MKKLILFSLIFICGLYCLPAKAAAPKSINNFMISFDFNYCYNSLYLGNDVKQDLRIIEQYVLKHNEYTLDELNSLISPIKPKRVKDSYDFSKYLSTSKDILNSQEIEVFNSNPVYGLTVLVQASYANDQEKERFGSNTWGTNGDAFRHSVWNALGANATSVSYMERFATAHETGSDDYDIGTADTLMDLSNNATGRSLLSEIRLPSNPGNAMVIPYVISNNIASAVANGQMVRFVVGNIQYKSLMPTNSATEN